MNSLGGKVYSTMMYRVKVIGRSPEGPVVEVFWVSGFPALEIRLKKIKDDNKFFALTEIVIQER